MIKEYIVQVDVDENGNESKWAKMQELVRCGECKHRVSWRSAEGHVCDFDAFLVEDNYFCARGKRKQ